MKALLLLALGAADPDLARVPAQDPTPFAEMTLGVTQSFALPLAGAWSLPAAGGRFQTVEPPGTGQTSLRVGALHFHGRAELALEIPLLLQVGVSDGREVTSRRFGAVDARWYPWALREDTVRPFLSAAVAVRTLETSGGGDAGSSPGLAHAIVVPAGVGLSARIAPGIGIDVAADVPLIDEVVLHTGVGDDLRGASRRLDLRAVRFLLSVKAIFDASPGLNDPGFREEEAGRWRALGRAGAQSGLTLALGPSARIVAASGALANAPALRDSYGESIFLHGAVGLHLEPLDADLRLAYRGFSGSAEGYGFLFDVERDGVFLEALKMFDPDLHGFVPFVGAGAGLEWTRVNGRFARAVAPSIVFGWDIRPAPSLPWLLRTGLRWIPREVVSGHDLAGLEFDFIQLVVFPQRFGR